MMLFWMKQCAGGGGGEGGIGEGGGKRGVGGGVAIAVADQKDFCKRGRDILTSTQDEEAVDDKG
jgi:hypothetical protein